jgi:hypothetical protein
MKSTDIKISDTLVLKWLSVHVLGINAELQLEEIFKLSPDLAFYFRIAALGCQNIKDQKTLFSALQESFLQSSKEVILREQNPYSGLVIQAINESVLSDKLSEELITLAIRNAMTLDLERIATKKKKKR